MSIYLSTDLIRVGGNWVPTDLRTWQNEMEAASDRLRYVKRRLGDAESDRSIAYWTEAVESQEERLATARLNYTTIRDFLRTPTGQEAFQGAYSNLPSYVHGELKLPSPIEPEMKEANDFVENSSANVANPDIASGLMGFFSNPLMLLFILLIVGVVLK